ncbi:MAG: hypothetical protein KBA91_03390 [Candidatus Moranbacteria bacterium]|nr:hypothetical protein [Candidatus Moranbacteria bacterium]
MKEQIRPIYSELQGYLAQAPKVEGKSLYREEAVALAKQLSGAIEELNTLTGEDYNKFKAETFSEYILTLDMNVYRLRLGGLISRLHGKYFFDEPAPFSGMPSMVITQSQSQSLQIQMFLDFQSKLDEKINKLPKDDKNRTFLEKVKSSLSGVKSFSDLVSLVVSTAKSFGLSTEDIVNLFT